MRLLDILASLVNELFIKEEWNHCKTECLKKYDNAFEERDRCNIYMKNKALVEEHNLRYELGKETYTMALNQFSDMYPEEIAATMLNLQTDDQEELVGDIKPSSYIPPFGVNLPSSIDWRTIGAVTRVKDQGKCGSCWAFAATGALEGQQFRKTKQLTSLSEQNLVDCSRAYGNNGCNGGLPRKAYSYIMANGGIDQESSYPYEGVEGSCRYKSSESVATIKSYVLIPFGDEQYLKNAVATIGPVAASMDATNLQLYNDGIYQNNKCNTGKLNHAVLIVGYGTTYSGTDYWLIKNSWGSRWGEQGYFRMIRNVNHCGIANRTSFPLI